MKASSLPEQTNRLTPEVQERSIRQMNIGIVTTWFERGAAYVSRAYYQALSKRHNVFIYARGEQYAQNDLQWDAPYVTWGRRLRLGIPSFIHWDDFRTWIRQNQLDLLIFNEQRSWDVILRSRGLGVLIGMYVDYYTQQTTRFFRLCDFLLCNTKRHFGVFKDHPQALYIPWGTNTAIFTGSCAPVSKEYVSFFHSCGLSPWRKGTDLLVRAFQEINGPARLTIHAQAPLTDPQTLAIIENDPRITLRVETVGMPGLYNLGDVYVYPSRLEGIGLTIMEAMACGLPVITPDNAPMNEFVVHGQNGRLVPVERFQRRWDRYYWDECDCNVQALTEAMQYYIDHRAELPEAKSQARTFAAERLDWKANSAGLAGQLSELRRLDWPASLARSAALYEYSRYPGLIARALVRKIRS